MEKNHTKAGLIGTITEEGSHIIGKLEGSQLETGTNEKGLESTGRATNEYFRDKYRDDRTPISLVSDGKDYSGVDFGEHVGDSDQHGDIRIDSMKIFLDSRYQTAVEFARNVKKIDKIEKVYKKNDNKRAKINKIKSKPKLTASERKKYLGWKRKYQKKEKSYQT